MSKHKRSRRPSQRTNSKRPRSDNPIIAVVKRDFGGHHPTVVLDENGKPILTLIIDVGGESQQPTSKRKWFQVGVSIATLVEIGGMVHSALLTGDKTIIKDVTDALKQANHLFNRDRELKLLPKAVKFLVGGRDGLSSAGFKERFELFCNNGEPLKPHQWNRLRKALNLDKLPTGKPRNSDTKQHKTVS